LVPIVISAYNRPEMQRIALASQTYDALELVIEENSTDLLPESAQNRRPQCVQSAGECDITCIGN
jgi:hypothetical protein